MRPSLELFMGLWEIAVMAMTHMMSTDSVKKLHASVSRQPFPLIKSFQNHPITSNLSAHCRFQTRQ